MTGFGRCACGGALYLSTGRTPYLRCARSKRRHLCNNKTGCPYAKFETQLLSLTSFGFGRIFASLVRDERPVHHPIPDMEATISGKEIRLAEMFDRFGKHDNPTIRKMAESQIDKLGTEIEADKARLARMRLDARAETDFDNGSYLARLREATSLVTARPVGSESRSGEGGGAKYLARANLAQQLRSRMTVTLHPDRRIELRIRNIAIHLVPDQSARFGIAGKTSVVTIPFRHIDRLAELAADARQSTDRPSALSASTMASTKRCSTKIAKGPTGNYRIDF